ncbi:MAG: hypothetical protein HLUCCA12_09685 [Rhodobacteraceae bacterium HLUCCA12]|nr:MAG: hypothetical protein HLUCCA12_09685 [Rhodobacteraceae bacterium HLUCCA12]
MPLGAVAEGLKFSPRSVESCLDQGGWRDCIGAAANACMEATEGGYATPVIAGCLSAEHEWWDSELNARYSELQDRARDIDAEPAIEGMPPRPSEAEALREMQRAWIAYRDATCRYEELQWWGGTGASGAYIGCLMRLTGEQALTLRSYLAEG